MPVPQKKGSGFRVVIIPVTRQRIPAGSSANWIYYLENTIRGAMGADVPVVYLQGACGDITQVDNLSPIEIQPASNGPNWSAAASAAK